MYIDCTYTYIFQITFHLLNQQHAVLVKRDTTLENVKAMYNRFVSESRGKVSVTYLKNYNNIYSISTECVRQRSPGKPINPNLNLLKRYLRSSAQNQGNYIIENFHVH